MAKQKPNSPLTLVPPKGTIATLDMRDGMVSATCTHPDCAGEVARYDARGRAWCASHFPGSIRFTVASHHWQSQEAWLADPLAFTIMAIPPQGWPKDRNIDMFAAPWKLVKGHRAGKVSDDEYTQQFSKQMQGDLATVKAWLRLHSKPFHHITLLCACPYHSLDEGFCHRFLVARLLTWLGCQEEAWVAQRRERRVAA